MSVISRIEGKGISVLRHSEWSAKYESIYLERLKSKPVSLPVRYAFSHITVTRDTGDLTGNFAADMRTLERIGYERFKSGISYNWVIDAQTGMIGEGQYLGAKGTHTINDKNVPGFPNNLNLYGHAVAMLGMPGAAPSSKFINSFATILWAEWEERAMLKGCPIYPHAKFAYKDCPTAPVIKILPTVHSKAMSMGDTPVPDNAITPNAPIVGAPADPDGSGVTWQESGLRGNHAYWHGPVEGSETDRRLDALSAADLAMNKTIESLTARIEALENS